MRVLGGLRVTDNSIVDKLTQSGRGVQYAEAFFAHMRKYCAFFKDGIYGLKARWKPVFAGFDDGGQGEDAGVVGAYFEVR